MLLNEGLGAEFKYLFKQGRPDPQQTVGGESDGRVTPQTQCITQSLPLSVPRNRPKSQRAIDNPLLFPQQEHLHIVSECDFIFK